MDRHGAVVFIEAHLLEGAIGKHAGIVDQDVEAAEGCERRRDRSLHRFGIGTVGCNDEAAPSEASDPGSDFFRR